MAVASVIWTHAQQPPKKKVNLSFSFFYSDVQQMHFIVLVPTPRHWTPRDPGATALPLGPSLVARSGGMPGPTKGVGG